MKQISKGRSGTRKGLSVSFYPLLITCLSGVANNPLFTGSNTLYTAALTPRHTFSLIQFDVLLVSTLTGALDSPSASGPLVIGTLRDNIAPRRVRQIRHGSFNELRTVSLFSLRGANVTAATERVMTQFVAFRMDYFCISSSSVCPSDSFKLLPSPTLLNLSPDHRKGNTVHATYTSNSPETTVQPGAREFSPRQPYKRSHRKIPAEEQSRQRRKAASDRERRRMTRINEAFDRLRARLPCTSFRLSKHDTLQMAVSYISELCSLLEASHTAVETESSCSLLYLRSVRCSARNCC